MPSIMVASSSIHIKVIQDIVRPKCIHYKCYSTTYHSRASECLQNIRGTELVVFVLISFPQMSNTLLLESVPLAEPQISNKIMCPYYPYVVLYAEPPR